MMFSKPGYDNWFGCDKELLHSPFPKVNDYERISKAATWTYPVATIAKAGTKHPCTHGISSWPRNEQFWKCKRLPTLIEVILGDSAP